MEIELLSKVGFDEILQQLEEFWGERHRDARPAHHPMFLYEFGDTAYVIREGGHVIAYLWGFFAATSPTGYIHLVAVRKTYRGMGLARRLYAHFMEEAKRRGCQQIKAITTPGNRMSVAFHRSLGFQLLGVPDKDGIPVVRDYRGPGEHWVVFQKTI